jgi:hypothetical protein
LELLVTHRSRLANKYGPDGWRAVECAVNDYLDAVGAGGNDAELFLLDGIMRGEELEPVRIKAKLQDLHIKTGAEYLLLLGGDDIVPFYRQPDQTPDKDLDVNILSDSYYTDFTESEHFHSPDMAVGRMPDAPPLGTGDNSLLVKQLLATAAAHRRGEVKLYDKHAGFSTYTWQNASKLTYAHVDPSGKTLLSCPPLGMEKSFGIKRLLTAEDLTEDSILFFNVHGHRTQPLWWGEKRFAKVPYMTPQLVDYNLMSRSNLSGSIIMCLACHGAAIHGRTPQNSLSLCALNCGALAFFGCTAKSYAYVLPDGTASGASGIDALFTELSYNLVKNKMRFGDALNDAKQRQMFHNHFDEKNVFGTILLGDPLLRFV